MEKGILYTRVSTREQAEGGTSLESQKKECKEFARKNKVFIPDENIFSDEGESAKFIDRPELQRMLTYVRRNKGKVTALYIWKIDRLARNLGDYYGIKVALAKYNVKIFSVTEPIEDDPVGRFLEAILAAAAQFDNEIRAIRSIGGMRARVEQGGWPHSVVIGYKKVNGRIMRDDRYADIITDILIKFSSGKYTKAEMSRYAFQQGIMTKSGRPKSDEGIKTIVGNLIYAGYTKNKLSSTINKGLHKPLVDESVIYKNLEILENRGHTVIFKGDELFPLRGVTILCPNCNMMLTASTPTGNGGQYSIYHCSRKTCTKKATGRQKVSADSDIVHKEFRELLHSLIPLDSIKSLYKVIVLRAWNEEYGRAVENEQRISREIERYRKLRQATNEKFIMDKITEEDRDAQLANTSVRLAELEEDREEADRYVKDREQIIDDAMSFISAPDVFWNRASLQIKQDIQMLLFPKGIVYDFETGFGTKEAIESYLLLQKISENSGNNELLVGLAGFEPAANSL